MTDSRKANAGKVLPSVDWMKTPGMRNSDKPTSQAALDARLEKLNKSRVADLKRLMTDGDE